MKLEGAVPSDFPVRLVLSFVEYKAATEKAIL
jgi:hypothetical protein